MTRQRGEWALLVQAGLVLAGYTAVRPMASYRAIELGGDNTVIGLLAASFSVLPLLLAYPVGRRADQFGPARVIVSGTVVFTVAGTLAATARSLPVLLGASVLLGLGHLICIVGQQSAVAVARAGNLDRGFGLLTSAGAVGQIVGPVAAGFGADAAGGGDWSAASVGIAIGTALCASSVVCLRPLLRTVPRPRQRADLPHSTSQVAKGMLGVRGMTPTLVSGGLVLAALDLLYTFLPAWAEERGVSVSTVGWLLAVRAVLTLLVRLAVDRVVRRVGRRTAIILSVGLAVVGLVLLPVVGLLGAVVSMMLLGVGLGAAQPLTMAWVAEAARPGTQGAAMGLRLTANRLAQTALPVGVGIVSTGVVGVFWMVAGALAISAGALVRLPPDQPSAGRRNRHPPR
ncbi:MFS transporter [Micromonospora sp. DT48]|uniref:MFS transporter n=1 Tax=unclassified Micromonospora TaxID=2617518 RepID=UPI0012BB4F4A|nr:MFS transporter [Micromonospora sp. CP22]MTK03580.1 MFS transporter [Micromonospora sp. CP22]